MIRIGSLTIDLERRQLLREGAQPRIGGRAFDVLAVLVEEKGSLVSKSDLLRRVWPNTVVEENNLQVHMSTLRRVLGGSDVMIQTVPGRGYRLVEAKLRQAAARKESAVPLAPAAPVASNAPATPASLARKPAGNALVTENNLPIYGSQMIGREAEIASISRAIESRQIVTLIGAGGIGKTRLAVEVARRMLGRFSGGVYFVSLASALERSAVLDSVSTALGVNPAAGPLSLARIGKEMRKGPLLFVVDNCEQVLEAAAELVEALAGFNPDIRLLATSREALRVANEQVVWVETLNVPGQSDSSEHIVQCSAVQLFLLRARSIESDFSSDEKSVELIGSVCRRLDGIPLAIELAAARATILGIETLATRLDDRIRLLTGGNRMSLPRHQTLRATLDWSHALLTDNEKTTLRRLGIFNGSFSMKAAIEIVKDGVLTEQDVIAAVTGLAEKSLLVRQPGSGVSRFRFLETTRAYALQRLDENGERRRTTLSHARFLASLLDDATRQDGSSQADNWQREMRELLDDLRAALAWALSPKSDALIVGETLAARILWLLFELSLVDECCLWARRALEALQSRDEVEKDNPRFRRVQMQVRAALAAALVYVQGPNGETRALWAEVLSSAMALGDHNLEARALWGLWNANQSAAHVSSALSFAKRYAALATESAPAEGGLPTDVIMGDRIIGIASHYAGEQNKAHAALDRFLPHADGLRQRLPLGRSINQLVVGNATLARVLWMKGEQSAALQLATDCWRRACEEEQAIVVCYVLIEAAIPLELLSLRHEQAYEAIAMLRDIATRMGLGVALASSRAFEQYLYSLDEQTPARLQQFQAALAELEELDFCAPYAMLAGQYAQALGQAGCLEEAVAASSRAIRRCEQTGDLWYVSELSRIHGELLLASADAMACANHAELEAETCFSAALETAIRQGARSLELKAAISLARLAQRQRNDAKAARVLEAAHARFPRHAECRDLAEAERLLEKVAPRAVHNV